MSATPSIQSSAPTFSLATLRQAAAELTAEQPQRADRIQRAVATVVACDMERFTFQPGWHIQSVREPDTYYAVVPFQGSLACSCPDALHRGNPCRHALAVQLYERAERLDAEQSDPTLQPIGYALTARGLAASTDPLTACAQCDHDALYHDGPEGACTRSGVDAEGLYWCDCAAFTLGDDAA